MFVYCVITMDIRIQGGIDLILSQKAQNLKDIGYG
jgi:hypothetical protein